MKKSHEMRIYDMAIMLGYIKIKYLYFGTRRLDCIRGEIAVQ
jgi:hypothetical protein